MVVTIKEGIDKKPVNFEKTFTDTKEVHCPKCDTVLKIGLYKETTLYTDGTAEICLFAYCPNCEKVYKVYANFFADLDDNLRIAYCNNSINDKRIIDNGEG